MITNGEARKLPLWKHWIETAGQQMTFGSSVTVSELSNAVGCRGDGKLFRMSVIPIKRWFRRRGMNFTARGMKGAGFVVAAPGENLKELKRKNRRASAEIKEAVVLGVSTPADLLNQEERRVLDSLNEKMATRLALMSRRTEPKRIN